MSAKWPTVKLGVVLRLDLDRVPIDSASTYPMVGVLSFGRGLFDREPIENGQTSYKFFYRLKAEHIVMSQLFGWEGALALSSDHFAEKFLSPQFPTFVCVETKLDRKFLGWLMRRPAFWEDLSTRTSGMGDRRRTLNPDALFACEIPLPPLAEQRRIVARIDELAAQIREASRLRREAVEEAEAIVTSTSRTLIGESAADDWLQLGHFVSKIENGKSPQCETRPAGIDEWGVLKVGAVSFGKYDDRENKALPEGLPFSSKYEVRSGDFIVSRANTTELVGACAIVDRTRPKLLLSDKTFRFHFRSDVELLPHWLDHVMKSPALRKQIARGASGTSPTMKNISKEKVLGLLLPPHRLPAQRRIVAELDALQAEADRLKALQFETAEELSALLPSVLDWAFRGVL